MKYLLLLILLFYIGNNLSAQYVYTIKADSVLITACDSAELIIENHTQHIPGFLYNTGNGRTEFRRGLIKINDTLYLIGSDTLKLKGASTPPALIVRNGVQKIADTIEFGNTFASAYGGGANQIRPTVYNQNNQYFNWMTQNNSILTISKQQYGSSAVDNNPLKANYITRFAAGTQGGLLFESNSSAITNPFSAPLHWINFKNTNPNSVSTSFFSDPIAAQIGVGIRGGTDGKTYHNFRFLLGNDSAQSNQVLLLYPSYTATSAGPIKIPTAVVKRLAVDQQNFASGADNLTPLTYDNPYSRLVVDAANQPVVFGSLPQSDVAGRILIIDNDGRVWKGDSTSVLSGGGSFRSASVLAEPGNKITADQTSSTSTKTKESGLNFEVVAGHYYKFKFVAIFRSTGTNSGIKLGLESPATEIFSANASIPEGNDGINSLYRGSYSSPGEIVVSNGVKKANADYVATIEGYILPSVNGTVRLTFAPGINGAQVSLRKGSMLEFQEY